MSLHKEYAITPEVFDPGCFESPGEHRLFMTLLKTGLGESKFLRCDKQEWKSKAEQCAIGTMASNALLKHLIKNKRLLSNDLLKSSQDDWVSYFEATHRKHPMAGILVDDLSDISNAAAFSHARVSEMTPDYPSWWFESAQSMHINCSAREISDCLTMLLRNARSIHLVDQYFDLGERRFSDVFRTMCHEIKTNAHCHEVFIHTSCRNFDMSGSSWETAVQQRFKAERPNLVRRQTHLFVCVWDDCMMKCEGHDRHCLTDLGGCQVGWGFQDFPNKRTTISALSGPTCKSLLGHFHPDKNVSPQLLFKSEF